jgi:hypothetical protein
MPMVTLVAAVAGAERPAASANAAAKRRVFFTTVPLSVFEREIL